MDFLEEKRKRYPEYDYLSDKEFADKYVKKYPKTKDILKEHLLSEKTACVVDSGYFISLARKLSQTFKKVYYCTPTDKEFLSANDYATGWGFPEIEKIEGYEFMRPEILKKIDVFIFPDIGYAPIQSYLRSIGKPVWGSGDATDYEIYRSLFLKTLGDLGLARAPYKIIKGLPALIEHLKTVKNKYIKVDVFRREMETWHHIDHEHSKAQLKHLSVLFGGIEDEITFVVQDEIPTELETGGDLWVIDDKYPSKYFMGYEKKNELYIASLKSASDMPDAVKEVNKRLIPLFKKYGYRNFFATEIRVNGKPYFIDPTFRLPGMSGEQILETCSNLAYVIWYGAHGVYIDPIYEYQYAVTASAYYCGEGSEEGWSVVKVPKESERWIKFSHCCLIDGLYHFPSEDAEDLGVVIGAGNTLLEAFAMLKKNIDSLKDEPVYFKLKGFFDLLKSIREAEKKGIKFSDDKLLEDKEILRFIE